MNRKPKVCALGLLASLAAIGAGADKAGDVEFRSPAARRAKSEYDRAIARARNAYDAAVAKAKSEFDRAVAKAQNELEPAVRKAAQQYAAVLQADVLKATREGELDRALRCKEEKEAVLGVGSVAYPNIVTGVWFVDFGNEAQLYYFAGLEVVVFSHVPRSPRRGTLAPGRRWPTIDVQSERVEIQPQADGRAKAVRYIRVAEGAWRELRKGIAMRPEAIAARSLPAPAVRAR